ncbi:broad substrate specificity ATP-binding cassette transporter ABCG2 [Latimeria chalumnae]|uniref:broad substrate specificity ATP-binding cassette transporter ABCG2 n=1 Tax=Latimeria chalumnae TaxID=7897 RepID=UPI00313DEF47
MTEKVSYTCIQVSDLSSSSAFPRKLSVQEVEKLPQGSTVAFHNVEYRVKLKSGIACQRRVTTKEILTDINGIMKPGLNAILGPTGSGKSSLLDILAARKDPTGLSGEVLIDGAPQPANFKCISGYVVQDDVVMGTLTVRENFQFSAALRLSKSISDGEKNEKIEELIQELGLSKVANSKVGTQLIRGVSGGERKRTNIGMELIIDPPVLFLDEPTTGLDASTAYAVLSLLKRMSKRGRTIIFSIHQPRYSIYKLFDSMTLLANGRMVYHGPAKNALDYFSSIGYTCEPYNNPTDFFLDIISGDSTAVELNKLEDIDLDIDSLDEATSDQMVVEKLTEEYCKSSYYTDTKAELEKLSERNKGKSGPISRQITYATSFFHQLKWLSKRTFKNMLGNPQTSIAQLGFTLFLGVTVGTIFFGVKDDASGIQNRVGAMFFITTNQCFSSISAIELFVVEKKIFMHEYISGYYRVSTYFISRLMADLLPMRTLPSIVFTCVAYFLIGFKREWSAFFVMMFSIMLVSITATSMGLAIAAGQSVVAIANLLMSISFVFMIIFSGLLVNLNSVLDWLSWLKYLSIPRYGLAALQVNEFTGLNFCSNVTTPQVLSANCSESFSPFDICTGEQYLASQGIDATPWSLWQNHLALGIMTLIFLSIAYLKLRFMNKFS